ncbi:expressed unknown protein [Seminavis robusta]|uniref:SH3 domain-containing protein n=1 Tax=Seminavis robusta TaxID=568900 RepID=A0A9N8EFN8_9STRA|nr:expressed unknown protein [Seminavis robusta]|eukprot:Sro1086_g239670.1 n/a (173) ;mRNA; f:1157-1675
MVPPMLVMMVMMVVMMMTLVVVDGFAPSCVTSVVGMRTASSSQLLAMVSNSTGTSSMSTSNNNNQVQVDFGQWASFEPACKENTSLQASLKARQDELKRGIGRRYVILASELHVHSSISGGPQQTDNVVATLKRGDIVTSQDRIGKYWVKHDAGGWSYTWKEGNYVLQLIQE